MNTTEPSQVPPPSPSFAPEEPESKIVIGGSGTGKRRVVLLLIAILAFAAGATTVWFLFKQTNPAPQQKTATTTPTTTNATEQQGVSLVTLDPAHKYGDTYANGLLPVGDKKYSTTEAKKGSIYMCNANFVAESQAGAQTRGPWFVNNNTQWDINKKAAISGNVNWQQNIVMKTDSGKRTITTNDLPDHHTGVFPVANNDPARAYDANPNTIKSQSLAYSLALNPSPGTPQCMGGEVGVMLTGVALFNGFDAGGRDAGAWEVQDSCDGHPQGSGIYHYHTLSRCIKDVSVQTVIGFALDGFPITGPKVGDKNYLTTNDLDVCHGIKSDIMLDGKKTTAYHYVMTQDFPYSASCFRAAASASPAQHSGGTQQQGGAQPTQQQGQQTPQPGQGPPPKN